MGKRLLSSLIPGVVLAALLAHPATAGPEAETTVTVAVESMRLVLPDGVHEGRFTVECGAAEGCPQPPTNSFVDADAQTVRKAVLGFDVTRTVEAAPLDVPVAQTAHAAAPEQLLRVTVRLREPGDLTVTASGRPEDSLDPALVSGSADPRGDEAQRAVTWQQPDADPGTYVFAARFAPNAPPGFTGTFVPEVAVTIAGERMTLLDSTEGSVSVDTPVQQVSSGLLTQRVAPAYGEPRTSADAWRGTGADRPEAWAATLHLDAFGAYRANESGEVAVRTSADLDRLAPGADTEVGILVNYSAHPEWNAIVSGAGPQTLQTAAKFAVAGRVIRAPVVDPHTDWFGRWERLGFEAVLRTARQHNLLASTIPRPAAGTLWDGDAVTAAAHSGVGPMNYPPGTPANDNGVLTTDWVGDVATGWTSGWTSPTPATEPNATNPYVLLRRLEQATADECAIYELTHTTSASIPVLAQGGDIDNRDGSEPVAAAPIVVPLPEGHRVRAGLSLSVSPIPANYRSSTDTSEPGRVTISPRIDPGGYLLESQRRGHDRTWAPANFPFFVTTPAECAFNGVAAATLEAPVGAESWLEVVDDRGLSERRRIPPGTWTVRVDAGGLRVQPLPGTIASAFGLPPGVSAAGGVSSSDAEAEAGTPGSAPVPLASGLLAPLAAVDVEGDGTKDLFQASADEAGPKFELRDGATGEQRWSRPAASTLVEAHPVPALEHPGEDLLVIEVGHESRRLVVLDSRTGAARWTAWLPPGDSYSFLGTAPADGGWDIVTAVRSRSHLANPDPLPQLRVQYHELGDGSLVGDLMLRGQGGVPTAVLSAAGELYTLEPRGSDTRAAALLRGHADRATTVRWSQLVPERLGSRGRLSTAVDVTGDGVDEAVILSSEPDLTRLRVLAAGDPDLAAAPLADVDLNQAVSQVTPAGDIDGSGTADLLASGVRLDYSDMDTEQVLVLDAVGAAGVLWTQEVGITVEDPFEFYAFWWPDAGDLTGDGVTDLVAVLGDWMGFPHPDLQVAVAGRDGRILWEERALAERGLAFPALVDLTGDGHADLIDRNRPTAAGAGLQGFVVARGDTRTPTWTYTPVKPPTEPDGPVLLNLLSGRFAAADVHGLVVTHNARPGGHRQVLLDGPTGQTRWMN